MPTEAPLSDPPLAELLGLGGKLSDVPPRPATGREHQMSAQDSSTASSGEIAFHTAEIRDLRAEMDRLRGERDRLLETQKRIMELLGTANADRLVHDLRNVLNERELYRALADIPEEE